MAPRPEPVDELDHLAEPSCGHGICGKCGGTGWKLADQLLEPFKRVAIRLLFGSEIMDKPDEART